MTATATKVFAYYGAYAAKWCEINGIKIHTVDNKKYEVLPSLATIYINRIGDKTRIVDDTSTMRNLIAISFDVEKWDKEYLSYKLQAHYKCIDQMFRHGTCQSFINRTGLEQILSGCVDARGKWNERVLYTEL